MTPAEVDTLYAVSTDGSCDRCGRYTLILTTEVGEWLCWDCLRANGIQSNDPLQHV